MLKRTNIYLSTIQVDKLNKLSESTGLSVAELIRRAIDVFFDKKEYMDTPAFKPSPTQGESS
jgi:predicted DNA-binding protein